MKAIHLLVILLLLTAGVRAQKVMGVGPGQVMGVGPGQVMGVGPGQVMGVGPGQVMGISPGQVMAIWPGPAPGSESWGWPEGRDTTEWGGNDPLAYNVTQPTLTYFPADPAVANGTAVIICPGGSFSYLHIKTEGSNVASYLNKKGVAAFDQKMSSL